MSGITKVGLQIYIGLFWHYIPVGRYLSKAPGPEEDDINTFHRYRDAIVFNDPPSGELEKHV
ncbi:hypothetical protein D3C86_1009090 [compost metagenome]